MNKRLLGFLLLLTLCRWPLVGMYELTPDEAYYHLWSQRLDWAYYSKGPGVALAIKLGTALFGSTEFGVRFLSPLLALGTALLLFSFVRRLYGQSVATWTVLAIQAIPIFQVGGLLMTIDPLSIFFWTAALYSFWLALQKSPAFSWHWPLTGVLIGLGFLCKYTNAMELVSVVLVLTMVHKYRGELRRPGFYAMLGVFLLCTLPPILWNCRHEWITVIHLRSRGGLDSGFAFHPKEPLAYLGAHLGVYSPLIFVAILVALWHSIPAARLHFKPLFLLSFALPLLLLYFGLSLKQAGEANWTAPAMVSLAVATAAFWHERAERSLGARRFVFAALIVGIFMSTLVLNTDLLRTAGVPLPYRLDPSTRLRGWRTTAEQVENFRKKFEAETGKPVFLIGSSYQMAASLSFYMKEKRVEGPGHPPVYIVESQNIENEFSLWPRYDEFVALKPGEKPVDEYFSQEQGTNPFLGRNALYITDRAEEKPATGVKRGFEHTEMIALYDIQRRGQPLRQIRIFACYNYRSLPL